jgi:hypothetical protein
MEDQEYSQPLSSHWSHVKNILSPCPPIGHTSRIFSAPVLPLVTRQEYPQSLSSHWSHVFDAGGVEIWLQFQMEDQEYSQPLSSHWSHVKNILNPCAPVGAGGVDIWLHVQMEDQSARSLYTSAGYTDQATEPTSFFFKNRTRKILMQKRVLRDGSNDLTWANEEVLES